MKSYRSLKIADAIRCELILMFQDGAFEDPRFSDVQIGHVELAKDSSHAKVFFTTLQESTGDVGDKEFRASMKELEHALNHAAGYVRSLLAQALNLGYTPTVRFHFDHCAVIGNRLDKILDQISHPKEDANPDSLTNEQNVAS